MKRRQCRQDRQDRLADVEGMDGPGQRAMALSDVDSDSTCKQQCSRQVGQKSPAASQTRDRERETLRRTGPPGRCTHARTTTLTRLTTLDSSTGWVHEYLIQHLPAAAHTLNSPSNPKASVKTIPDHAARRINGLSLRQHAHVTLV